jgi:dephospho-CoA kinase
MDLPRLIMITGMPGSGKTTFSDYFKASGYEVIRMGDVLRELRKAEGLESSNSSVGNLAINIRQLEGEAIVAEKCLEKINVSPEDQLIIEGVRSLAEVERFSEDHSTVLVAVHASRKTRHQRLFYRGRDDDPVTIEEFTRRDLRELDFGLGRVIALADYMVVNESPQDVFQSKFRKIARRLNLLHI